MDTSTWLLEARMFPIGSAMQLCNMIRALHTKRQLTFVVLLTALICSMGCSSPAYIWAKDVPAERAKPAVETNTIHRGDIIGITVMGHATLSGQQTVGDDGTISMSDVGTLNVSDKTVQQAAQLIEEQLGKILTSPKVSVLVVSRFLEVSILGEVSSPGKYRVQTGDGVANALALAGGLTEFGHPSQIYLVRASEPHRIRFRLKDLLSGGNSARAFALRDGDILVVE